MRDVDARDDDAGTSPSSTSWSTRANVTVNSYCEKVTFAKFA